MGDLSGVASVLDPVASKLLQSKIQKTQPLTVASQTVINREIPYGFAKIPACTSHLFSGDGFRLSDDDLAGRAGLSLDLCGTETGFVNRTI